MVPFFVLHSSLLAAKSVDSVVAHDAKIFHTGYLDYTVAIQILLDSYYYSWYTAGNET